MGSHPNSLPIRWRGRRAADLGFMGSKSERHFRGNLSPLDGGENRDEGLYRRAARASGNFDLHLPDFVFNRPEERMFAKLAQVRVTCEPFEIVVTQ
jgi:hypothetical protein